MCLAAEFKKLEHTIVVPGCMLRESAVKPTSIACGLRQMLEHAHYYASSMARYAINWRAWDDVRMTPSQSD